MSQTVLKNNGGFTLVEMMVALVILSISILALTSVTILTIRVNVENEMRNTSVRLVGEVTEYLFGLDIADAELLPGSVHSATYDVNMRGITKTFTAEWEVTPVGSQVKQIEISIKYNLKGVPQTNRAVVFRTNTT